MTDGHCAVRLLQKRTNADAWILNLASSGRPRRSAALERFKIVPMPERELALNNVGQFRQCFIETRNNVLMILFRAIFEQVVVIMAPKRRSGRNGRLVLEKPIVMVIHRLDEFGRHGGVADGVWRRRLRPNPYRLQSSRTRHDGGAACQQVSARRGQTRVGIGSRGHRVTPGL